MKIAPQATNGSSRPGAKAPPCKPKATLTIDGTGQLVACSESEQTRWTCSVDADGLWAEVSRFGSESGTLHCAGEPGQANTGPMRMLVEDDAGNRVGFLTTVCGNWTLTVEPRHLPLVVNALIHASLKGEISSTVSKTILKPSAPSGDSGDVE